ncbi:MarP family serine protease [Rubrobacter marinus]|uniref:MarP family serine protease n=1 Tax=Rubrobacter marinus TaxID=2653852 RepID=UPI00140AD9C8|nr:MarP family serine protease [Rubrobacter marinus]
MSVLDPFVFLFVLLLVWRGARLGFLAGAFSLAGVVLGAALGSRLAPALLGDRGDLLYGSAITLASILAFAVIGDILARSAGGYLREKLASPASRWLDGLGGAALGAALSLTLVWVAAILALSAPFLSPTHPAMRESAFVQVLGDRMPSHLLAQAVARLDPLPEFRGPEADVAEPDENVTRDPDVSAAASRVVRISGVACGYGVEGSGWVAGKNLVVTNAHVVAGELSTRVQPAGTGVPLPAKVVVFDERNDVAVLRVKGLGLPPLPLDEPGNDEPVAILGFPENGPYDVRSGRTGETERVISSDAYNRGPVERTVTSFRGYVRPGNSGGPVVNGDGAVVATIFASRADSDKAGYGIPSSIVQQLVELAKDRRTPVPTDECAN